MLRAAALKTLDSGGRRSGGGGAVAGVAAYAVAGIATVALPSGIALRAGHRDSVTRDCIRALSSVVKP